MRAQSTAARKAERIIARARKKEARLLDLYQTIETRLGTSGEQPNDLHAIREIAHRLISLSCVTLTRPNKKPAR